MTSGIDVPKPVNVINLLVENRATVALTDSQFIHVIAIKRQLDSTNAPNYRRIDSVQRLFKPGPVFADPSPQRRDSLASANAVVREMIADIEENIADAREKAFALLSAWLAFQFRDDMTMGAIREPTGLILWSAIAATLFASYWRERGRQRAKPQS